MFMMSSLCELQSLSENCSIKSKKFVDGGLLLCEIGTAHGKKNNNTTMKKTLLIAAAALAASVISSQAQVYSQNIVGYVNQAIVGNAAYTLMVAPLQTTNNANNAEQLLPALQPNDNVLIFNGAGFDTYVFATSGLWFGPAGPGPAPTINAGTAFFYENNGSLTITNTAVGSVTLSNNVPLAGGAAYTLVGSTAPIGTDLENTNLNLPLQPNDNVLIFNGNGYDTYVFATAGLWFGPAGPGPAPTVSVGQGFFYEDNSGSTNWVQNVVVP